MRYLILVALNIPVILLAFLNLITRFKMGKMTQQKFRRQMLLWLIISVVLLGSFPVYNHLNGRAPLDSSTLSVFDIFQTTAIIAMIYVLNTMRQKAEETERRLRGLHEELSITLSQKNE